MKVAFYTPTASGGHARFTQCMMEGIRQAAPDIDLVLCTSEDLAPGHRTASYRIAAVLPALRPRKAYGSTGSWALSRLRHYPRRDRLFLEWVREERPDVVHLQEWFPFGAARLVRRLQAMGTRVVVSVHNLSRHEQHFPGHAAVQAWFEHRGWRQADRLIVMSAGLADQLCQATGIKRGQVSVVPHFVWPGGSEVPRAEVEAKRLRGNALLFGAIRRNKGVEGFIDALAMTPELTGTIAGHCPDPAYSQALTARILQSGARITFQNRFLAEEEIAGLFATASVAAFPYTSFGSQSGALFTAVAHETPAVGTRVGALGATIDQEGLGLSVAPRDTAAFAGALRELHAPRLYAEAITQVWRLKREQGIVAVGCSLLKIYRELLTGSALQD